ncbi:MAG: hypothetical protein HQ471_00415 [Flavobacteriales bacterium]|nr:hypothetical protein [Flavobacteriales bacterium]
MITYDWNCKTVDAYPQDGEYTDLVYNVHWIVTGVSDVVNPERIAYSASNIGTQTLDTSDVTEFIPFEDLTNEQVVVWTQEAMGVEQVTSIEASIATQIDALITPTTVTLTIGEPVPTI